MFRHHTAERGGEEHRQRREARPGRRGARVPAAVSIGVVNFVGLVLAAPLLAIALDIRRELRASGFFDEPETDPAGG